MNPSTEPTQLYANVPARKSVRKKVALWLMIGPTALLVVALILFAITNSIAAAPNDTDTNMAPTQSAEQNTSGQESLFGDSTTTTDSDTQLFNEPSPGQTIANILLFITGTVGVIAWLPGLITGIILLTTAKKQTL